MCNAMESYSRNVQSESSGMQRIDVVQIGDTNGRKNIQAMRMEGQKMQTVDGNQWKQAQAEKIDACQIQYGM